MWNCDYITGRGGQEANIHGRVLVGGTSAIRSYAAVSFFLISTTLGKTQEWEIIPETFANPDASHRVKLPPKQDVREKHIITPEQTVEARLR